MRRDIKVCLGFGEIEIQLQAKWKSRGCRGLGGNLNLLPCQWSVRSLCVGCVIPKHLNNNATVSRFVFSLCFLRRRLSVADSLLFSDLGPTPNRKSPFLRRFVSTKAHFCRILVLHQTVQTSPKSDKIKKSPSSQPPIRKKKKKITNIKSDRFDFYILLVCI